MKVDVRFFASLIELTGRASETVEVGPEADVSAVWRVLVGRHPRLAELSYKPLVACDMSYAEWDSSVAGIREIAFLPPVSGG